MKECFVIVGFISVWVHQGKSVDEIGMFNAIHGMSFNDKANLERQNLYQ